MFSESMRRGLALMLALALGALACGGGRAEPTATPLPRPTQRPAATATQASLATVEPTAVATLPATPLPQPTSDTGSVAPLRLSDNDFVHQSGAFSLRLPEDWEIDEKNNSVFVTSPDDVVAIEITFTNVGIAFDETALANYINAVEENWFGSFASYQPGPFEPQSDGSIGVFKTLELSSGIPQTAFSYYWQEGTVVYTQDFWVDSDQYEHYVAGLLQVANSMRTDPAAGAQADLYQITYRFAGPRDLFEIYVPYGWTYETETGANSVVDTFTSPDRATFIENITYDDGEPVSKSQAGEFARLLLAEYYEVNDIRITGDVVQPDGSERLTWHSRSGGFEGVSFFETRGTTFLLLTWIVDTESFDLYQPVWASIVESYVIPDSQ
jgi:hypothetical protein